MKNGFKLIGLATQTTNKYDQSAQDIAKLWELFFAKNCMEIIPNRCSSDILSIYTDYASDYTDEYTCILGIPVTTLEEIPEGFIGREFPAGKFKKFVAIGIMPEAIQNTWESIWQQDKVLNRSYSYDYEVYGDKSQLGENSEVEIFVGVR